jgi:hypothetical protein
MYQKMAVFRHKGCSVRVRPGTLIEIALGMTAMLFLYNLIDMNVYCCIEDLDIRVYSRVGDHIVASADASPYVPLLAA